LKPVQNGFLHALLLAPGRELPPVAGMGAPGVGRPRGLQVLVGLGGHSSALIREEGAAAADEAGESVYMPPRYR
jgi:hypothetical protein